MMQSSTGGGNPARPGRQVAQAEKGGSGRRRRIFVLAAVAVGILLLVATVGTGYALQFENQDAFCASCHTQPETRYYEQSLAQEASTLAAFHAQKQVRCIDCHSGSGPFGRAVGLSQGSQDLMAYYSGHYHAPAITTNQIQDVSCTKCHRDMTAAVDFNNHFHRFLPQWQAIDPNAARCVTCHTSHPATDATQGYRAEATVRPVCDACHAAAGRGGEEREGPGGG